MAGELLLVVLEDLLVALFKVGLLVAGEGGEVRPPARAEIEGDAARHDDGRSKVTGGVALEGVLLQGEVAEELGVLLDILGDLRDEGSALPEVGLVGDALAEEETDEMEGADGAEGPVEVAEDLK